MAHERMAARAQKVLNPAKGEVYYWSALWFILGDDHLCLKKMAAPNFEFA
jgi:hypothetical protein